MQAKRQCSKKAVEIFKEVGFTRGIVDPCLHMKQSARKTMYITLCIDDNLMIGNPEVRDKRKFKCFKNRLSLKVVDGLKDYLSCEVRISQDMKRAWLCKPNLLESLEKWGTSYVNAKS